MVVINTQHPEENPLMGPESYVCSSIYSLNFWEVYALVDLGKVKDS